MIKNFLNNYNHLENPKLINDLSNKNILNFINYEKILKTVFIFIILIYLMLSLINNTISNNFNKIKLKQEILNFEDYYKVCNTGALLNKKSKFKKNNNPQISIISAIYKKESFILRFIRSIQNQNFTDIEIILIDDYSEDNTVNVIKNLQKEDERIILIKNKKNKGTLISRNEGILFSKGKYLIIPDGDDIISKDIINQCFLLAEQNNFDMIRFNTYLGNKNIFMYYIIKYMINKIIYQPDLQFLIF